MACIVFLYEASRPVWRWNLGGQELRGPTPSWPRELKIAVAVDVRVLGDVRVGFESARMGRRSQRG